MLMLGDSLIACIHNEVIRIRTKLTKVARKISMLKWQWTGHVCRRADGCWIKQICSGVAARQGKRSVGHPEANWLDNLRSIDEGQPLDATDTRPGKLTCSEGGLYSAVDECEMMIGIISRQFMANTIQRPKVTYHSPI